MAQTPQAPSNSSALRQPTWLDPATAAFVLLLSAWIFSTPLRSSGNIAAFAQDDFFYYLQAARSLIHGHGSTFDGSTLTNGYHPLYFLVLCAVSAITSTLRGVFSALWLLDTASAVAIFMLARRIVRERIPDAWLSNGIAGIVFYLSVLMISEQMEVTLTLPLGLLFLLRILQDRRSTAALAITGICAALLTLSRLDSILLVIIAAATLSLSATERRTIGWRGAFAFAAGFLPLLLVYFAINAHFFHRLMPISGSAKQLRHGHALHLAHAISTAAGKTRLMFALSLLGVAALCWTWRHLTGKERAVYTAALLFPFAHWGTVLTLSDWPMWGWYSYGLRFSLLVTFLLLACIMYSVPPLHERPRLVGIAVFLVGTFAVLLSRYKADPEMAQIAYVADEIRLFAETHSGRYAMGDRAGMVGYLNSHPTIQMEGLMEDDAFLQHIAHADSLHTVLDDYGVNYYVGFTRRPLQGCLNAVEPANAGPDSPVMRGTFCGQPAATYSTASGTTVIYAVNGSDPAR